MPKQTQPQQSGAALLRADLRSGEFRRCYVFCGEEAYLRDYYLSQLRAKIVSGPAEAFNSHRFDAKDFRVEALGEAVEALPVMAEHTFVQLDDVDLFHLDEDARGRLVDILEDIPDYCTLALVYDVVEYKPDRKQRKLCDALARCATVLDFPKQTQASLIEWTVRHFGTTGKKISADLCAYLIFLTGGTMTALAAEIGKIAAYAEGPEIMRSDIDAVVIPVLDAQVFDITDALAARDFALALEKLETILRMQLEPIPVLAAIGSNLRRLLAARTVSERGFGSDELTKLCSIGDYAARKTMSAARNFTTEWCEQAVLLCAETDYRIKTSYDEPERLLELLLLRLAEEARHA